MMVMFRRLGLSGHVDRTGARGMPYRILVKSRKTSNSKT